MSGFMVAMAPLVAFKSEITAKLQARGDAESLKGATSGEKSKQNANSSASVIPAARNGNGKNPSHEVSSAGVGSGAGADRSFAGLLDRPTSETGTLLGLGGAVGYLSGACTPLSEYIFRGKQRAHRTGMRTRTPLCVQFNNANTVLFLETKAYAPA